MSGGVLITEEHGLSAERPIEKKLEFFVDAAIHHAVERLWSRVEGMMANMRGERGPDPDFSQPVTAEDLERFIQRIARDHDPGVRITNRGRSGPPRWLNKLLLGVGVALIVGAITTTATVIVTVASLKATVESYIKSNDARVSRVEQEADDTQRRLDRGAGLPQ